MRWAREAAVCGGQGGHGWLTPAAATKTTVSVDFYCSPRQSLHTNRWPCQGRRPEKQVNKGRTAVAAGGKDGRGCAGRASSGRERGKLGGGREGGGTSGWGVVRLGTNWLQHGDGRAAGRVQPSGAQSWRRGGNAPLPPLVGSCQQRGLPPTAAAATPTVSAAAAATVSSMVTVTPETKGQGTNKSNKQQRKMTFPNRPAPPPSPSRPGAAKHLPEHPQLGA